MGKSKHKRKQHHQAAGQTQPEPTSPSRPTADTSFYAKAIGLTCLLVALLTIGIISYTQGLRDDTPLNFADEPVLASMWNTHKEKYWEKDTGRTLDNQQNNLTTSEGQSYTMLRAVWMDDRPTFDKAWAWTKQQLQHQDDKLFAWRWGQKPDGSYGILTEQGGQNAAADADIDIALALLMAENKWQSSGYRQEALPIIEGIWNEEVMEIAGRLYLLGNDLEKTADKPTVIVNPSYYAPYAFRAFALVDSEHDWSRLVGDGYALLTAASSQPLGPGRSANLPPDWVLVNKTTGKLSAPTQPGLTTNFSYDAMRTVWRVALDYEWHRDRRAKTLISRFSHLASVYQRDDAIYSTYSHDGSVKIRDEVPAMYGATLGYFAIKHPELAESIYTVKLRRPYTEGERTVSYYSDSWAWFGMALVNNLLPNLTGTGK
ncbi:hypothetical protein JNJ66_01210 [Candidatus Saccharibacteria bacterium]|nr:hypothetical protein [Candidatus Saccharibacteria bacterium]